MKPEPTLKRYGVLTWIATHWRDMRKEGWFTAYYSEGVVHLCFSRVLYAFSAQYRWYVEQVLAHEYGHHLGLGHESDDDLMGPKLLDGWRTDVHKVMAKSAHWRLKVIA